jgi:tetratricopeptide (TPR) repeat protein
MAKKHSKKKSRKKERIEIEPEDDAGYDPRAAEVALFRLDQLLRQQEFESAEAVQSFLGRLDWNVVFASMPDSMTQLERAQDRMYDAWSAAGRERVDLAREALDISPDCADAYVLLAEESVADPDDSLELFRQGMIAGERALGPKIFQESAGRFWGIVATRPYMRAREGFAVCLALLGRTDEAVPHYREMLRLNPQDNQGIRFRLLQALLAENLDDDASNLLDAYPGEPTADWAYGRALLMFRRHGESAIANATLNAAFEVNPFVPLYVTGMKKLPPEPPLEVTAGEASEAITYVAEHLETWAETPGALRWFVKVVHAAVEPDSGNVLEDEVEDDGDLT